MQCPHAHQPEPYFPFVLQLRNFLHVVSTDKNKYELKYFNIDSKAEDGEE